MSGERQGPIEVVKLVSVIPTRVWIDSDFTGDKMILMQHECDAEPFVYVRIAYDYRYTDNSAQRRLAEHILALLTGTEDRRAAVEGGDDGRG
jgi:hypothetical protein